MSWLSRGAKSVVTNVQNAVNATVTNVKNASEATKASGALPIIAAVGLGAVGAAVAGASTGAALGAGAVTGGAQAILRPNGGGSADEPDPTPGLAKTQPNLSTRDIATTILGPAVAPYAEAFNKEVNAIKAPWDPVIEKVKAITLPFQEAYQTEKERIERQSHEVDQANGAGKVLSAPVQTPIAGGKSTLIILVAAALVLIYAISK